MRIFNLSVLTFIKVIYLRTKYSTMKIDVETILSVFAVISGFGAVLLFTNTGLFESPLTISLGILSFSTIVFNLTYDSEDRAIHLVGVTIFSLGFIISMTLPILSILSDTIGVAIILAIICVFFLVLNQLMRENKINGKYLKIITVLVITVFVIFAFVDVTTGEPEYKDIELMDNPQVSERSDEFKIAEAKISTTLPKRISEDKQQNYAVCAPNHNVSKFDEDMDAPELEKDEKVLRVQTRYDNYNGEMIIGSETKEMYVTVPPIYDRSEIKDSDIVMRDNCTSDEFSDKVMIMYPVADNFQPPRPY